MTYPKIYEKQGKKVLVVKDKPFIMLSGEVKNSNSSSVEYMEQVWDKADELEMNSLLLPVSWAMVEPEEGVFDFTLVDGLIEQARRREKKLGLLWFGAWKNAQCYYAPEWVKTNPERFKRAEIVKGRKFVNLEQFHGMAYTTLSYLCEETKNADAKAFAEFMKHLKAVDGHENTVIIVQVENETGVMGSPRENSDQADALFASEVPQAFAAFMKASTATMAADVQAAVESGKQNGNWKEVFGEVAEEIFSAYHIASYVNFVASAGKEIYPLPLVANCWLDKGAKAGYYPSGGPVARVMEVWKYCAPSIDIIAPDIYVPYFCDVCDEYLKLNNPLFIPETATHSYAGLRQVYAVGHHHALCYAPFGFENMGEEFTAIQGYLFGMDTDDPALKTPQDPVEYSWYTKTLNDMMPMLTEKYGTPDLQAVISERKEKDTMIFGDYGFKITMSSPMLRKKNGVCLVLRVSENEFYIIASGCIVAPFSANEEKPHVDVLRMEDGHFADGNWCMARRLNGDEVAGMRYEQPILLKIKLFVYK